MCLFKMMGCSTVSSIYVGIINLFLVKWRQGLSTGIKTNLLFCFCKFLFLVDLKAHVCLNRTKPWLELSIKFNQFNWYSIGSFLKALVGFSYLWLHLKSLVVYLCLKHLTHPSKWIAELCAWKVSFFVVPDETVYSFFSFRFDMFQKSVYLTYEP